MLFRKPKRDPLLSGADSPGEDNAVKKEEELSELDREEAAVAHLVQMGGEEEDADADAMAEKFLKQMGSGEEESEAKDEEKGEAKDDSIDVPSPPAQPEEVSDTVSEKVEEKAEGEAESKKGDGLLADIFEQEEEDEKSFLDGLITSLPDVTVQELFQDVEEVKGLMSEWRQNRK